jgi:hypothetical protein
MPPFIRVGDKYLPSLGVAAALMAERIRPEDVRLDGEVIRAGDRRIPLVPTKVPDLENAARRHDQLTMLINYRAPKLVDGERPYAMYEMRTCSRRRSN